MTDYEKQEDRKRTWEALKSLAGIVLAIVIACVLIHYGVEREIQIWSK